MSKTVYGGGHWNCDKCGCTIKGSSIVHECLDSKENFLNPIGKEYNGSDRFHATFEWYDINDVYHIEEIFDITSAEQFLYTLTTKLK